MKTQDKPEGFNREVLSIEVQEQEAVENFIGETLGTFPPSFPL